jgi:hypothetical protein
MTYVLEFLPGRRVHIAQSVYTVILVHSKGEGLCSYVLPDANGNNCTLYANIVDQIPSIAAQPMSHCHRAGWSGQNRTNRCIYYYY